MSDYHQPLLPSTSYHLFSRAVGKEKIFLENKNYTFFLNKLSQHINAVADLFTYSLLPNHFHLVVKIKSFEDVKAHFEVIKKKQFNSSTHDISDFIMERFSNFLNSYTKAFNKIYSRKGALFMDYLKRSRVEKDSDFTSFIFYTHKNAVHHGYTKRIGDWPHDAYHSLISNKPTKLLRAEVLEFFGGVDEFIKFHQQPVALKNLNFRDLELEQNL